MIFGYFMHTHTHIKFEFILEPSLSPFIRLFQCIHICNGLRTCWSITNKQCTHSSAQLISRLRHVFENLIKLPTSSYCLTVAALVVGFADFGCCCCFCFHTILHWTNNLGPEFKPSETMRAQKRSETFVVDKYQFQLWNYIKFITSIINVCVSKCFSVSFFFRQLHCFLSLAFQQILFRFLQIEIECLRITFCYHIRGCKYFEVATTKEHARDGTPKKRKKE